GVSPGLGKVADDRLRARRFVGAVEKGGRFVAVPRPPWDGVDRPLHVVAAVVLGSEVPRAGGAEARGVGSFGDFPRALQLAVTRDADIAVATIGEVLVVVVGGLPAVAADGCHGDLNGDLRAGGPARGSLWPALIPEKHAVLGAGVECEGPALLVAGARR